MQSLWSTFHLFWGLFVLAMSLNNLCSKRAISIFLRLYCRTLYFLWCCCAISAKSLNNLSVCLASWLSHCLLPLFEALVVLFGVCNVSEQSVWQSGYLRDLLCLLLVLFTLGYQVLQVCESFPSFSYRFDMLVVLLLFK